MYKAELLLCAITPIFDPALDALKLLISALISQKYNKFIHISISNGPSEKIKQYIQALNDDRFIYKELPFQIFGSTMDLLCNVGLRRNYCLKNYVADRYVFLDADLNILSDEYFSKLVQHHNEADILLVQTLQPGATVKFPRFPYKKGSIDIANYSINEKVAKYHNYPTTFDDWVGYANDWRFFDNIKRMNTVKPLDFVFAQRDVNTSYKRMTELSLD